MTTIANANVVLVDKDGNKGHLKNLSDNDLAKLSGAIIDIGQVVDPATHMPIEATTASVGVVQLATAQDIKDGTANKVVDAKELAAAIRKLNPGGSGLEGGAGLELGDIGIAPLGIDETDNCRRYLNGQVILQSQFEAFTTKLKSAIALYPDLSTTETNWQSTVTLSPLGQCGKFVIDDEAGTIRLPKVVNVMGALDLSTIGQTVEAGLPNIEGSFNGNALNAINDRNAGVSFMQGAFWLDGLNTTSGVYQGGNTSLSIGFNASRSSSIYGNSTTVQQEAIKYPYFIQVATSNSEDVQIDTQVRLNNPFSLFMPYWSPIELNNLSWLRSNKQWNNGSVYISAYEFLLEKYNAGTEQTETIAGVSVTYILADNGMKIITDKSVYDALISASGSAFFFVLDTENTQFILPYTNGFAQFGDELGKFTEAGLPNIEGRVGPSIQMGESNSALGAFTVTWSGVKTAGGSGYRPFGSILLSARDSNPIYGNSPTVQPNSVTGYLYFYVGEVEQDANIIATSGLAESVSRKADNDLSNVTAPTQAFKNMSMEWGIPNYSAKVQIASGTTITSNGILIIRMFNSNTNGGGEVLIDGTTEYWFKGYNQEDKNTSYLPIKKGSIVSFNYSYCNVTVWFVPFLGE